MVLLFILSIIGTQQVPWASQLRNSSCTGGRPPTLKSASPQYPMIDGLQQLAADTKEILDKSVHRKESLCLNRGLQPFHGLVNLTKAPPSAHRSPGENPLIDRTFHLSNQPHLP